MFERYKGDHRHQKGQLKRKADTGWRQESRHPENRDSESRTLKYRLLLLFAPFHTPLAATAVAMG